VTSHGPVCELGYAKPIVDSLFGEGFWCVLMDFRTAVLG